MKRDMDLARQILLKIEEEPQATGHGWISDMGIEGRAQEEISYHVMLLQEAGLIEAHDASRLGSGPIFSPKRLTWAGHEFLDAARQDGLWQKAKQIVAEKTGGVSFEVLKALLTKRGMDAVLGQ